MTSEDNYIVEQKERLKYRPTKIGKTALFTAIISLVLGLLCILLSGLSVIGGMIVLIAMFLLHAVALLALFVVMIDVGKFNKYNHINHKLDNKIVAYLLIGIIIGFVWGKIL